jgi:hypothetical protein
MFLRDHLDDVASDMSVFHRVDDILDLPAVDLWKLAWRLGAYQGRMAVIVQELQEQQESGPVRSAPQSGGRQQTVQGTAAALRSHPEFNGAGQFAPLFEITEVPAST